MSREFSVELISGAAFTALPDETILTAAQRARWLIRYGCRNGNCAACEATLLRGCVLQRGELIESTHAPHKILLCQCNALSDLRISLERDPVPGSIDNSRRYYARLIGSAIHKASDSISFITLEFLLPAGRMPTVLGQQYAMVETDSGALQFIIDTQLTSARKLTLTTTIESHLVVGRYYHVRYPFSAGAQS